MTILVGIVFGVIIGALAALLAPMPRTVGSVLVTVALGGAGALLGGWLGHALGLYAYSSASGALVMSVFGAVLLLAVYHAIFARRQIT